MVMCAKMNLKLSPAKFRIANAVKFGGTIISTMKNLRAGCAENKKFEWNKLMENEFKQLKQVFKNQIRLSPLDPSKRINIATDGANSTGVGFVIFKNGDDNEVGKNVRIIKANSSSLKTSQKQYSAIDTELLALKFACDSSYFYPLHY